MKMSKALYQEMASLVQAIRNCQESGNEEWEVRHIERLEKLTADHMPSGAGIDAGTKIELDECEPEKLVFYSSYHHMNNEVGMYDGWSDFTVTVTPSLANGINVDITGDFPEEYEDTGGYLFEVYDIALREEVPQEQPV
jgi:hypothetical protein